MSLKSRLYTSSRRTRKPANRLRKSQLERLETRDLLAVDIVFDYSYDDGGFFTSEAKAAIERAAEVYELRLQDTLAAIPSAPPGNSWSAVFDDPETGGSVSVPGLELAEGEVRVYLGARAIGGSTLGIASTGYSLSYNNANWLDTVVLRGQTGDNEQSTWGGSISFDSSSSWHFGEAEPSGSQNDLYSVALHELGHLFGIANQGGNTWSNYVKPLAELSGAEQTAVNNQPGYYFTGPKSVALYGSPILVGSGHFGDDVGVGGQEAALTPSLTVGTRKPMSPLDWAALDDIGWEVSAEFVSQDLVALNGTGQWYAISDDGGAAFVRQVGSWTPGVTWGNVTVGDFNGDGVDDVIARNMNTNAWVVGERSSTGLLFRTVGVWSTAVAWENVTVSDFNGDGKIDVAARGNNGTWVVGVSDGTQIATTVYGAWTDAIQWVDVLPADINGDGQVDIIGRNQSAGGWIVAESQGTSFTNRTLGYWSPSITWTNVMVDDFNGDGMDDIYARGAGGRWIVSQSTGTAITTRTVGGWAEAINWQDIQTLDLNGDGYAELIARNSSNVWIASFFDDDIFRTVTLGAWSTSTPVTFLGVADTNGDGKAELIGTTAAGSLLLSGIDGSEQLTNEVWGTWAGAVDVIFAKRGAGA